MSYTSDYMSSNPPPPMPPHGSADPDSPDYNPDRAAWMDANPNGTADWQHWIQGREKAMVNDLLGGSSVDDIYQTGRGEEGKKAGRPDQLVLDFLNEAAPIFHQRGLNTAIQYGHAFLDPVSGLYYNYSPRDNSWTFKDAQGNQVQPPPGTQDRIIASGGLSNFSDPVTGKPLGSSSNNSFTSSINPGEAGVGAGATSQSYSGPLLTRPTSEIGWTVNPSQGDWESLQKTNPSAIAPESAGMVTPVPQSREKSPSALGDVAANPFGYAGNTFGYNAPGLGPVPDSGTSSQVSTGQKQTSQQLQPGEAGWQAKPFVPGMGQDTSQTDEQKKQQQMNSAGIQY